MERKKKKNYNTSPQYLHAHSHKIISKYVIIISTFFYWCLPNCTFTKLTLFNSGFHTVHLEPIPGEPRPIRKNKYIFTIT